MSAPRSVSKVRVRYAETDKMGVVYHANYFVWFEVGRTDLLRNNGWTYKDMEAEGLSLPVIEAHCDYKQPARYDDELEIRVEGARISPARVAFKYEVVRASDAQTLVIGHTVHAAIDRTGKPCRLPERVTELFA